MNQNDKSMHPIFTYSPEVADRPMRILACILIISALFNILSSEAQTTATTASVLVVNLMTDEFASESNFKIIDGNKYDLLWERTSGQLENLTLYSDTIYFDSRHCFQFVAEDGGNDGLGNGGYFQVLLNNEVVVNSKKFQSLFEKNFNCKESEVCELAINVSKGKEIAKGEMNSWFEIRPVFDTYYSIFTISECDTRIWIYEDCNSDSPDDQAGALFYSDDYEDKNAGLHQILLKSGKRYYCRISKGENCNEDVYVEFVDLELRKGCMDPASCNFDPLANLDSEVCVYSDCAPDLIINQEVLESTIYLDSIINDSQCLIEEGCLHGYGKRDIIRFSTQIENIGTADYIIGTPEEESSLFSEDNCHKHWHYLGYAEYLLFDGIGSPQPVGFKNGFCALDYRCEDEKSYKYSCDYMGISAGCYDTYDHDLLCQWIDVTDVPDGDYTVVVRVNHTRSDDLFGRKEIEFENNWAQVCIRLDRSSGALILEKLLECETYTDCLNVEFGNSTIDCNGICGGNDHYGDINEDGTVDSLDILDYKQKILDGVMPEGSCYDLTGDQKVSSYDLILLDDCLFSKAYDENVFNHTHCDFPKSYMNNSDSVILRIDSYDREGHFINLSYRSNTDFISLDARWDGINIASVALAGTEKNLESLSFEDKLMILLTKEDAFEKSVSFIPFLRVYLRKSDQIQACVISDFEVVNKSLELVQTAVENRCIDINSTASVDHIVDNIFQIFPNPVSGNHLFVRELKKLKGPLVRIYDVRGSLMPQVIHKSGQEEIAIGDLPQGIYYLKISTSEQNFTQSFVKF